MAGGNPWTPEQRMRLADALASGISVPEISRMLGRTQNAVRLYAAKNGLISPAEVRHQNLMKGVIRSATLAKERRAKRYAEICAFLRNGGTQDAARARFRCSGSTIKRALKKAGMSAAIGRGKSPRTNVGLQRGRQKQSEMALARWQSIRDDVISTLNSGAPVDALVEKYGNCPDYFRKWLRRDGWKRPAKPKPEPKQRASSVRAPTNILSRMGRSPAPAADTRGMMIPDAVRELQRFAPCFRADVARDKFWTKAPTHYVFRGAIYPVEELDDVLARVRCERLAA